MEKKTRSAKPGGAGTKKRRIQKRHKDRAIGTAIILLAFIALLGLGNLFHRDVSYSENENRILAGKPEFSMENLVNGQFMKDMEAYLTDQFVLRDQWIKVKYYADRLVGKKEANGVYIGSDGYLMGIPEEPNDAQVEVNVAAIRSFATRHEDLQMVMTLVPNITTVCNQYLPKYAPVRDQEADIRRVQNSVDGFVTFRDITDALKAHKNEPIYYKTDHHWTSRGAGYAFEDLKAVLGISEATENYKIYPVSNSFAGTQASKVGYHKVDDIVEIYVADNIPPYMVDYVGEKKNASIYDITALDRKDKYEVFFGGNHARVSIYSAGDTGRNLLVLKDSYANCFIQFLLPYYDSITLIDPRYYYDDIDQLIAAESITNVLFLYNVNTYMGDTSLADVIGEA